MDRSDRGWLNTELPIVGGERKVLRDWTPDDIRKRANRHMAESRTMATNARYGLKLADRIDTELGGVTVGEAWDHLTVRERQVLGAGVRK